MKARLILLTALLALFLLPLVFGIYNGTISLNSPAESATIYKVNPDFMFTPDMGNETLQYCQLNVSGVMVNSSNTVSHNNLTTFNVSVVGEGAHNWSVSCNNSINEWGLSSLRNFTIDTTAPVISNVTNTTTNVSAVVSWYTDELANALLEYGSTASLGTNLTNASFVTYRTFTLSPLTNSTPYFYNVTSCDVGGNCVTQGPYNFTTNDTFVNTTGPVILDVDNGSITNVSAIITVSTDAAANLSVRYSSGVPFNAVNSTLGTTTIVYLKGLTNSTTYFYNVTSCKVGGYCSTSTGYQFTTNATADTTAPTVVLNSPQDGQNMTGYGSVVCTIPPAQGVVNVTMYGNWSGWHANETNSSGLDGTDYGFSWTLPDGSYEWNCLACDISDNCAFAPANRTFNLDTSSIIIYNVTARSLTNVSAVISWDTAEGANSSVNYGLNASLGTIVSNSSLVISRNISLTNLTNSTLYYYNVTTCDFYSNCNTTGPYSFQTTADPCPFPGSGTWTIDGENIACTGVTINLTEINIYNSSNVTFDNSDIVGNVYVYNDSEVNVSNSVLSDTIQYYDESSGFSQDTNFTTYGVWGENSTTTIINSYAAMLSLKITAQADVTIADLDTSSAITYYVESVTSAFSVNISNVTTSVSLLIPADTSQVTITNSTFTEIDPTGHSTVTLTDVTVDNLGIYGGQSTVTLSGTTVNDTELRANSSLSATDSSIIDLLIRGYQTEYSNSTLTLNNTNVTAAEFGLSGRKTGSTITGSGDIGTITFHGNTTIIREYQIYVYNETNETLDGVLVNVSRSGVEAFSGTTSGGFIYGNLTFNWSTYLNTYNVTINQVSPMTIGLASTTPVNITIDTQAPTVNTAVLSDNYTTNSTSVTITANITDASTIASVSADNVSLTNIGDIWSGTVLLYEKPKNDIMINATDNWGNSRTHNVSYVIDGTDPVISNISVNDSVIRSNTTILVTVNVTDEDNTTLTTVTAEGLTLSYNATSSLWEGYITNSDGYISVVATDPAGNSGIDNLSVTVDDDVPVISISYPVAYANVSGTQITVNYTINGTGSSLEYVGVKVDGITKTPPLAQNYSSFNLTFPGAHWITVSALDEAMNHARVYRRFYSSELLNVSNWTDTVNDSIGNVTFIQILDENGTDITHNDSGTSINQNFTLIFNMTDRAVRIKDLTGNKTGWSNKFTILNYSQEVIDNVTNQLGTSVVDMVQVQNFSNFANHSEMAYVAFVRLPGNSSRFQRIYFCSLDDLSDCVVVSSVCGNAPCYVDSAGYVDIYVPHFSVIFGANDTVAPHITILTPVNGSTRSNSYRINLNVSINENSTCSWKLDNGTWTPFAGSGTSFSTTFNEYTNGNHTVKVNCSDGTNENMTITEFNISDTVGPQFTTSTSPSATTSAFSFSFSTDEPSNHVITVVGEDTDTQSVFTIPHSESIAGLSENTLYTYNITVCDKLGNCNKSEGTKWTDDDDDSGSSSSRSSSGDDFTFNPRKTQIFTDLEAGDRKSMTIGRDDIDVTEVQFTVTKAVTVAKIIVEGLGTARPTSNEPTGELFQYVAINQDGFPSDSLEDILIKFRVTVSWLNDNNIDPATVIMQRYSSSAWSSLTTRQTGSDSVYHHYEADSPSFSNFAITGTAGSGSQTGTTGTDTNVTGANVTAPPLETVTGEVVAPPQPQDEPGSPVIVQEIIQETGTPWWVYLLFALVIVGGLGVLYHFYSDKLMAVLNEEKKVEEEVKEVKEEVAKERVEVAETKQALKKDKKEKFEVVYELSGGTEVRNVHELLEALNNMEDETFMNYVNDSKNDFATWVNNVFKDYKLASKISDVKTRHEMCMKIEQHLKSLKVSPEDEESRILESLREHELKVPKTDLTQLRRFAHLAMAHGKSKAEIRRELLGEQWPEEIVDILLKQIYPK